MKVLALLGSPRRNGNTATLLRALLEGLNERGNHSIDEVRLEGLRIHPCRNCDSCRKPVRSGDSASDRSGLFCAIQDDMQGLFRRFIEADFVVFASPVYWWSISAQLKLFIDRLYALDAESHPQHFRGKRVVLLLTHYEEEPCSGADLAARMFGEIAEYTQMRIVGDLRYSSGSRHARESLEKLAEAQALGRRLGAP